MSQNLNRYGSLICQKAQLFETTIRQFWCTATTTVVDNMEHIRATVHNQQVILSEATIRENVSEDWGIQINSGAQIIKNALPPLWRYIVHVFIHCLSIRKGGFDSASSMVASGVLGLIKGRDCNFSRLVFGQLKENLTGGVKEKFLVYPRFLQIIINHLHPNMQQDGHIFVFDHMTAKTLSYMKSSSKRTNRVIADIPLFGHILGEEEENVPDIDPQLLVESSSEEGEAEQGQGNQEQDIDADQQIEQDIEQPILEAPFIDQLLVNLEPVIEEQHAENIEEDVNDEVKENIIAEADSNEEQTEPHASSSMRLADSSSYYEKEEPLAKKIKTGLESLTSSSECLFDVPEHLTPSNSHTHIPPPSPQPSPLHTHVPTLPASPVPDPSPYVPIIKTLSLEKTISQQQQDFKALSDLVEQIKASMIKSSQQETPSAAQGETTSAGGPSSPAFVSNTQSALTVFTGQAAKTQDDVEVKIQETSADVVILDEEEIRSDHELNALLDEIDNFGFNNDYPMILATEDLHEENVRYFTEEGEEIQALSEDAQDEASVKVDLVHTEPTPTESTETTHTESTPNEPINAPKPNPDYPDPKRPWMRKLPVEWPPKYYEWFAEYQELKRPPVGWKYDNERGLYIVNRYKGGVEHFKTSHVFSSLPRYDLRALAKLQLQNHGKVNEARNF
ncbi:hypothetical protein L1987_20722 [Smallanthus sonchifolius]|uniref:Uncharacterized protein n=1 Tax=Smallanthus sonchifolius TaxID=185202 RepID=A0ACB9IU32_9ASTR|nr:hypothetical protein L1987_20722 [Smallanthus sonchifolius]